MQLATLRLDNLVIHRIPRKAADGEGDGPLFSDVADPQTPDVRAFFRQRLSGVMATKGLPIERDPDTDGTTTDAVGAILADETTLVAQSRVIAQRLYDVQDRRSPEGILLVAVGEVDSLRAVGVLKLEHEKGVRAEEEQVDGGRVFRIVLHHDLLLTQKTVVFKGSIFRPTATDDATLTAMGSDLQVEGHMATFFLTEFLGCRLVDNAPIATEKYFDAVETWIAGVDDPERKARYEIALLAQMHAETASVDPDRFARETFSIGEHQPFIEHLTARGVGTVAFPKDTANIERRIRRLAYNFDSGLRLLGPPEAIEEHVTVESADDGRARVTIEDELTSIRGRG